MTETKTSSHSCALCQQEACKRCAGCRLVWYCSSKCQEKHWMDKHKNECVDIVDVLLDREKRKNIGSWMFRNGFTFKKLVKAFYKGQRTMPSYMEEHHKTSFEISCGGKRVHPWTVMTGVNLKTKDFKHVQKYWPPIFELPTFEAVAQVKTLLERVWDIRAKHERETFQLTVLELGCGVGLWNYLLRKVCDPKKFQIIATDIVEEKVVFGQYHTEEDKSYDQVDVEILDYKKALEKYSGLNPVVFWSWVPLRMNPTPDIVKNGIRTLIYSYEEATGTHEMVKHPGYKTECFTASSLCQTDSLIPGCQPILHMCQVVLSNELDLNEKCWVPW